MPENKLRRLSEAVPTLAPEGANDAKWFLIEHQLTQARISAQAALSSLAEIVSLSENDDEARVAKDCHDIIRGMMLDIKDHYATYLSYLSDTDVPERISRKEL